MVIIKKMISHVEPHRVLILSHYRRSPLNRMIYQSWSWTPLLNTSCGLIRSLLIYCSLFNNANFYLSFFKSIRIYRYEKFIKRGKIMFTCPICHSNEYDYFGPPDITNKYWCRGCGVVFTDPEKFGRIIYKSLPEIKYPVKIKEKNHADERG